MPKTQTKTNTATFERRDILSFDQFTPNDLFHIFTTAKEMAYQVKKKVPSDLLRGTITTLLFYEPSSRTFASFNAAIKRLGGQTIDIQNPGQTSSVAKGETLADTIRTFEAYSDLIIMRHPIKGAAKEAANAASIPVINAGDGIGEHPTQALLDLYTLYEKFGRLNHLTGVLVGDLLNGRTIHSLLRGLSLFEGNEIYLLAPQILKLSPQDKQDFRKRGLKLIEITNDKEIPKTANFWYWTRVQKERFTNLSDYERVKTAFTVTPELMKSRAGKDMILMHPLPRVGEIAKAVDKDPRAVYLRAQIRNGMFIRMAVVSLILGKKL